MLDSLNLFAAGACNLFLCVVGVELLGVFPGEGMACDEAV